MVSSLSFTSSIDFTPKLRMFMRSFSENDLLNIRNFGVKSIEEVKDKLETMRLGLKA